MPSSVSESLELILDRYTEARVGEAFGSQHELWSVFEDLKQTLSNQPSVVARPTLRATWSAGQGNWAKVPWIALLEEQETGTTQRGVYCVFLFRQDMSGVYLTFNQGVTQPKNQHGRPRAHQLLQNKAIDLRRLCGDLVKREFHLDDDIDLRTDSGLGSDYENSTVAYKLYEAGQVPTDDLLSEDLEAILKAYDRYLAHSKKWREAIDICRQILSDREAFDSQETEYKREIAGRIRAAFNAVEKGEAFVSPLKKAFNPPNNLTSYFAHGPFLQWATANIEQARDALLVLVDKDISIEKRVDRFLEKVPDEAPSGLGTRLSVTSFLLMGLDPENHPMYRTSDYRTVERVLGWPDVPGKAAGRTYSHHLAFAKRLLEEFQLAGLEVRDLLDAQSLIWILANDESPAFASWRGEPTAAGEEPWLRPLEHPRGLEAELQRILAAGSTEDTREILGAIFRRAILLHQRTGTEGFLGVESSNPRTFSIMVGNLFACAAGRVLYLLVDDDLHVRESYEVGVSGLANNELVWAKVDRERLWLDKLLDDEKLWVAYERMLGKFASIPRAKSNHNNVGKMSVLTGERLGQSDEKLADLVADFRQQRGYPTDNDKENLAAREEFASYLSPKAIKNLDWNKFTLIYQSSRFGRTGRMPGLNRYISGADEEALEKLQRAVEHLLYAELPLEERLDDVLSGEFRVKHFGEAVATKLLAICYPDRVLPIFVFRGPKGKDMLMRDPVLGLDPPEVGTRGELALRSNDLLRERLAPYFADETNAMKEFLYWLHSLEEDPPEEGSLATLAAELLLNETFLQDAVALLRDKKQIIFYGPPGTGKTYIARKLVEHLAGEVGRHEIVQFHPSYSYEDFVQGYRPLTRDDGSLAYELKPGPLMRLARQALDSSKDHVLLIDEINRGNLPRILGELLYLLEYREDEVALMYGEDSERFTMPENLLIIGTMNTADRSIALIDAALRRRFHFVPLFPGEYPLNDLLLRWLKRNSPDMTDVATLVDQLNARLRERFGPHLQIGPSYFMKESLSQEVLKRVWKYDIMPFLEDQLFGQEEELKNYELDKLQENGSASDASEGTDTVGGASDEPTDSADEE